MGQAFKALKDGILDNNPTFMQVIGTCPTLAVTTSAINGIGMGLSTAAVLICSNLFISLLRKFIPDKVRIPCYIVVIASFVTIVELLLKAYIPSLNASLGLYIPLIVVNCIILGRAEAFASKNGVLASAADGLCQGLGYTMALVIVSAIRELLGSGTFGGGLLNGGEGIRILPEGAAATLVVMPVGGFLVLGCVIAGAQYVSRKLQLRQRDKEAAK